MGGVNFETDASLWRPFLFLPFPTLGESSSALSWNTSIGVFVFALIVLIYRACPFLKLLFRKQNFVFCLMDAIFSPTSLRILMMVWGCCLLFVIVVVVYFHSVPSIVSVFIFIF